MTTPANNLPLVAENTLDPAAGLNASLDMIDGLLQVSVEAIQNDPPVSPSNGQCWLVGAAGTGAWLGQDNKVARYEGTGGTWSFFNARLIINQADESLYGLFGGVWKVLAVSI